MIPAPSAAVRGLNGLSGTVLATSRPRDDMPSQIAIKLDDGLIVVVPENQLILQADGTYLLARDRASFIAQFEPGSTFTSPASSRAATGPLEEIVVPRVEERLRVEKKQVERTIRIEKSVKEREEVADLPLMKEDVEIERVPMNQLLDGPVGVREEGDVTIIPVLEEILVVEKRLMLKEELRLTRRRNEVHEPQRVKLRSEEVQISRDAQ
jgi:uncharacterized protein (TIGR02271 family)